MLKERESLYKKGGQKKGRNCVGHKCVCRMLSSSCKREIISISGTNNHSRVFGRRTTIMASTSRRKAQVALPLFLTRWPYREPRCDCPSTNFQANHMSCSPEIMPLYLSMVTFLDSAFPSAGGIGLFATTVLRKTQSILAVGYSYL